MAKYTRLPAISGKKLIKLLRRDGFEDHIIVTVVLDSKASLDEGTLSGNLRIQAGKYR